MVVLLLPLQLFLHKIFFLALHVSGQKMVSPSSLPQNDSFWSLLPRLFWLFSTFGLLFDLKKVFNKKEESQLHPSASSPKTVAFLQLKRKSPPLMRMVGSPSATPSSLKRLCEFFCWFFFCLWNSNSIRRKVTSTL